MIALSSFLVAASSLFALTFGAPLPRSLVERTAYSVFGGDGTMAAGWPAESSWLSFDALWKINEPIMRMSCSNHGWGHDNDATEIAAIKSALEETEKKSGVNKQFLLAVMIQESKGCVRAPTTNYGVRNPGLFQDFNGQASCNEGTPKYPCPTATITQMVEEGAGIGLAFGLQQALDQSHANGVSKYYQAARIYNSGSLPASGNLGQGGATHCYASDIANRLKGWADDHHSCDEAAIGSMSGSAGSSGSSNENTNSTPETPKPYTNPTTVTPPQNPDTPANNSQSNPTAPKAPGAAANCTKWYTVKSGDNCSNIGVSFDTLRKLNSGLDAQCSNLWLGSAYCVAA